MISALWAVIHTQYDWYGIFQIFLIGLLLGWVRWRSGSTLLTIVLHALINAWATLQTIIKVELARSEAQPARTLPRRAVLLEQRGAVVRGRRLPGHAAMRRRAEEVAELPLHRALQVERAAAGRH